MSLFSIWNGTVVKDEEICISANNRSFKYGDGCFETMKVVEGQILLSDLHFQRLFTSLKLLQFTSSQEFTAPELTSQIIYLLEKNGHQKFARVRLMVYRGSGGLYDVEDRNAYYIIQSWAGDTSSDVYNEKGLKVAVFYDAKKAADFFSAIKSNNYLGYAMAAMWAKDNRCDDAVIMNGSNRVADATIANVFIVDDGVIKTPSLNEGCVDGVMRRYLLNCFQKDSLPYSQTEITQENLLNASEVFLTNANFGIRWVQMVNHTNYKNTLSSYLHQKFIAPLFKNATF
ncbi:aminotransferase class IV [Segetibacter aerophilus]|uniref:branched-chain-amino-acid transaminase n=1 Tax=Segetibacter aerophilus TaxID=670293 RepID=A0A512BD10_9BACT|nr:aminotransferase class IV [Segetibacter aerophilus]GEO09849.1 aminodeoxychorismate lyase [Segetibacter aerophilus]